MAKKIVVLVSEPISGEVLKDAVGGEKAEEAEVLVIAPRAEREQGPLLGLGPGRVDRPRR